MRVQLLLLIQLHYHFIQDSGWLGKYVVFWTAKQNYLKMKFSNIAILIKVMAISLLGLPEL